MIKKGQGKFDRASGIMKHNLNWRSRIKSLPNKWKKCISCKKRRTNMHHRKCNTCWDNKL